MHDTHHVDYVTPDPEEDTVVADQKMTELDAKRL